MDVQGEEGGFETEMSKEGGLNIRKMSKDGEGVFSISSARGVWIFSGTTQSTNHRIAQTPSQLFDLLVRSQVSKVKVSKFCSLPSPFLLANIDQPDCMPDV